MPPTISIQPKRNLCTKDNMIQSVKVVEKECVYKKLIHKNISDNLKELSA